MAQNIASSLPVAPSTEEVIHAGPVAGRAAEVVVYFESPLVAGAEVYTHPIGPATAGAVGTYYPFATQVAIATAAMAPGDQALIISGGNFRDIGVTIFSNEPATVYAHADVFSAGAGTED